MFWIKSDIKLLILQSCFSIIMKKISFFNQTVSMLTNLSIDKMTDEIRRFLCHAQARIHY